MIRTLIRSRIRSRLLLSVSFLSLGLASSSSIALKAAEGDLDVTFGGGGKLHVSFGETQDEAAALAVQSDGRIVVAANVTAADGSRQIGVARLAPNGALDPTFGINGRVITSFPGIANLAEALAIQSDGKIVVAGSTVEVAVGPVNVRGDMAIVRFNANGSLDTSFGNGGLAKARFGQRFDSANAVAIQGDGKIVAAGIATFFFNPRFGLARFNTDGSLDTSFDFDGKVDSPFGGGEIGIGSFATALSVLADGRIVAAGTVGTNRLALVRYQANGEEDQTFGVNGRTVDTVNAAGANAMVIQPDGRIIVAGRTGFAEAADFLLARYDANGARDLTFGTDGLAITDINATENEIVSVALQADGRIVAAGTALTFPTFGDYAVARYDANGVLDPTFGTGGIVTTDIVDSIFDRTQAMVIQPDGRILVAGDVALDAVVLVRYAGPPPHELAFFPHGAGTPGTAGALTMTLTAPTTGSVLVNGPTGQSWLSDPLVNGTLAASRVQLLLPCSGVNLPTAVRLATTDAAGANEQVLGEGSAGLRICTTLTQTIDVPVTAPVTLTARRLKLTIRPLTSLPLPVPVGSRTVLRATSFVGTP